MAEAHQASPAGDDHSQDNSILHSTNHNPNALFDIAEDSDLPPLPLNDDDDISLVQLPSSSQLDSDASAFMDKDMRRELMHVESSFLPELELEIAAKGGKKGADDTYLFGGSPGNGKTEGHVENQKSIAEQIRDSLAAEKQLSEGEREGSRSPVTPPSAYKTPYHGNEFSILDGNAESKDGTTELDELPSSPTARASERNQLRTVSNPIHEGLQRTPEQSFEEASAETAIKNGYQKQSSDSSTVRIERDTSALDEEEEETSIPEPTLSPEASSDNVLTSLHSPRGSMSSSRLLKRPSFLHNRTSSQRSSVSSRSVTSEGSDATLGADFSLQSGGAVPGSGSMRPGISLSRLPSMSSIASSNGSSFGDAPSWSRSRSSTTRARELEILEEERGNAGSPPETPRAGDQGGPPTDTVIAQHVQNIQVPETVAREYREKHPHSPARSQALGLSVASSRQKSNLTLKEQNSKIDKLSKENFDLKLKIHFLDQALQNRSEEGVKDMINKNVQLQTDLANEKKDNQALRKKMRELERKVKGLEEGQAAKQGDMDDSKSDQSEKQAEMEEEIIYLRETLQETEMEIERLREENLGKEVDKRKLADYIKSTNERKASENDKGVEETIEMWKDLLESETARREQADEDAEKLREELRRVKTESAASTTNNHVRNVYNVNKRHHVSYNNTRSDTGSGVGEDFNSVVDSNASTVVEQLKHENAELRRDLSAQTSMLTSRNRERERLQQEIEDLKINQRRHGDGVGARSVAGDSIFDRSVSRAHNRAESRASGHTRVTQLSDVDEYDKKFAQLRDELARVKMTNQDLERELNAHLDILQNVEEENRVVKEERDATLEDLQSIQTEREEALLALQESEEETEALRNEANDEIEKLDLLCEQKDSEIGTLQNDFGALQQEMKNVSESVVRLEDDLSAARRKEQDLEQQISEIMEELEQTDQKLRDTSAKNERLDVQLESSQTEVQFLREEQEGDKIKIGDLEAALNAAQTSLQDERERISEERRQREVLDSQEKADWQKMVDELNDDVNKFKGEGNRLRKNLSAKDAESSQWKERLETLEGNLREALGSPNSTSSSILKEVTKLQRDLEHTLTALDVCRQDLNEKERLLRGRDQLLESTGLESQKLSELLEKERAARRADRNHFDQMQRSQQSLSHTLQQNDNRANQLEVARNNDRRKYMAIEKQYLDQLTERNNLLLALWNRLSTLCGADFMQKNSLVDDQLPSVEVISRNLVGFSRNMNLAVRTVEVLVGGFRSRIRDVEKNLWKDFQTLEHAIDVRTKRIDHLEKMVAQQTKERLESGLPSAIPPVTSLQPTGGDDHGKRSPGVSRSSSRSAGHTSRSEEITKLKSENRLLKAELQFARHSSPTRPRSQRGSIDSGSSVTGVIPAAPKSPPGYRIALNLSPKKVRRFASPANNDATIPMAKPEKAEKPKKPLSKAKSISTINSSKPKKKSPPAKVQLSSEFVQDSSDEDDDPPALPVETKEPTVKKRDPVVKKKGPVKEDKAPEKPKTAVVEVSSEEESSSEESDDSESETSKSDGNSTKVVAKSASADVSESESETEKEKDDSSDDDGDSSSGISVVAPTNKGKAPAVESRPHPTTAPTSHVSETRPAPAFQPPHSFKTANSSTSKSTDLFSLQTTAEQQIWYITAPANVPLLSLKELAMDKLVEGASVMTYKDVDYSFTIDDTARPTTAILLPSESGFTPQPTEVQRIVHLRQVVKLPTAPQSEAGIPSSAATTIPQQPQFEVQKRTKREQPKGLKMRYRPSGAGTGDLGHIGSSDDEEPALKRPKSSTAPNVGKKRKERDDDVAPGDKKKKKKKEKHRLGTEDAMEGVIASNGTPKKTRELISSSSGLNGSAKLNGVETPKKKDKEKKKNREKERA
ncbi:hypothetical protein EG328_008213 [Venturia inaequalis]|uniref:Centrosomin N-terminal motif 1 domain-containing protein n=1 Tax=Venturia inaequalis TaxID=5025 RepID=A0A8H3V7T4_VENIN|nr:hypothetical protein EG328_008213 [Venturia inaequalis]